MPDVSGREPPSRDAGGLWVVVDGVQRVVAGVAVPDRGEHLVGVVEAADQVVD